MGWLAFLAAIFAIPTISSTRIARRAAAAPALMIAIGALFAILFGLARLPQPPADWIAFAAKAGLAVLGFASAAQLRVSRLARQCPSSFRLTCGGAPLYFFACSLAAFIMLPQLSIPSAMLVGAALMLNGAAFDRKAVVKTPAPAAIKAAVRNESAAIIALGIPLASLVAANATVSSPNEPSLAPLMAASLSVLKGFAFGGVAGLAASAIGAWYRRRMMQQRALDGQFVILAGVGMFIFGPALGCDPIVAATSVGLLWGEQTSAASTTRLRIRRYVDRAVTPLAYLGFGAALAPRLLQADMLVVVFALAAVTVMRAGPRLAILQTPILPKESQMFLAWFGGAPGAASALFVMTLIGNPALIDADAVLTVTTLAVIFGVAAARLTSRPLARLYLRQSALARQRKAWAN
ncbi:MAG TPA: cation:proton antiporter [Parvularculaceae bacterium]|nr:cation:proton antiporter [Parvularculaceae bacterium]